MRPSQFAPLLSLISLACAWPWPPSFVDDLKHGIHDIVYLFRRQNNNNGGTSTQAQPGSTSNSGTPKTTAGTATATGTASITGSVAQSTATDATASFTGNFTQPVFDPRDPPGGVSMISPNAISGPQYYKIGDWVHFAWNYTSLQATPTAINVAASCSANNYVYTIAMNQSIQPTGEVYWDTGAYQQTALTSLLTNKYTLFIWDANKPITAVPSAGYLGSYNQFVFGMYTPQPYKNYSDFQCPTCNGAASLEHLTLKFLLGMVGVTVLSFTWFVTSLSVL